MSRYIQRLASNHNRSAFRCGNADIDRWFHEIAGQADRRHGSARVWVLVDEDLDEACTPIGFYALLAHAIAFEEVPPELRKGQPSRVPFPAILLGQLAVDEEHQGKGIGAGLLADVVRQAIATDERVATPLLVVDAADEGAAGWYEHYGFHPFHADPYRLAIRLKDARKTFGLREKSFSRARPPC